MQIKKMFKALLSICMVLSLTMVSSVSAVEPRADGGGAELTNLVWNGNVLSWDSVEGVTNYSINIGIPSENGEFNSVWVNARNTSIDVGRYISAFVEESAEISVDIRAQGGNSEFGYATKVVNINHSLGEIGNYGISRGKFTFQSVLGATGYFLQVVNDGYASESIYYTETPDWENGERHLNSMHYQDVEEVYGMIDFSELWSLNDATNIYLTPVGENDVYGKTLKFGINPVSPFAEINDLESTVVGSGDNTRILTTWTQVEGATYYDVSSEVFRNNGEYEDSLGKVSSTRAAQYLCVNQKCELERRITDLHVYDDIVLQAGDIVRTYVKPMNYSSYPEVIDNKLTFVYESNVGVETTLDDVLQNYVVTEFVSDDVILNEGNISGEDIIKPEAILVPGVLENTSNTHNVEVKFNKALTLENISVEVVNAEKNDEKHEATITLNSTGENAVVKFNTSNEDYINEEKGYANYRVKVFVKDGNGITYSFSAFYHMMRKPVETPTVTEVPVTKEEAKNPTVVVKEEEKPTFVNSDGQEIEVDLSQLNVKVEEKSTENVNENAMTFINNVLTEENNPIEAGLTKVMVLDIKLQVSTASDLGSASDVNLGGGKVTVFVPYPEGVTQTNFESYNIKIFHVHSENDDPQEVVITPVSYGMTFEVDSFSDFVITYDNKIEVAEDKPEQPEQPQPPVNPGHSGGSGSGTPSYKPSTVTESGVSVDGKFASGKVSVGEVDTTTVAYNAVKNAVKSNEKVIKELTLTVSNYTGALNVTFEVGEEYNGKTVRVLRAIGSSMYEATATVVDGKVTIEATNLTAKNTVMIVCEEDTSLDLSEYSNYQLDVFANSRVTSVKADKNGFSVFGYMWINNVAPSKNTWREIVFVNAEDATPAKAYRKNVNTLYNTFLNSNPIATNNGKLDLSYANYGVTVNPSSMQTYDKKATEAMAAGTYLVYMRISDGKNSYLFPLVDRVLSDGSTMESTGTLPAGFTVSDAETRTLVYNVK